ncbi:carbamoyltransferase [Methylosoma difficile]
MGNYYIGLSVTYHDPALAIIDGQGEVLFAEATERFLQNKRALNCEPDQLFYIPQLLREFCPAAKTITIASNWRKQRPLYENIVSGLGVLSAEGLLKTGLKKLVSPLENYQLHHKMACQRNAIAKAGLNLVRVIREQYPDCQLRFADFDHHHTHAAMACYSSPFREAACAVIDSYGENGSMAFYHYADQKLHCLHEGKGFGAGSLGFFYMKLTELCGFSWLKGEEWKVMGLAPYGQLNAELYALFEQIVTVNSFACRHPSQQFFANLAKLDRFKRQPDQPIEWAADCAYTGQLFFADKVSQLLHHLCEVTGLENLTLAGGCALNSSFNGQISRRTAFKNVHIPSAPADDGCALGAAWLAYHQAVGNDGKPPRLLSPYLGAGISDASVERLKQFNRSLKIEHLPQTIGAETARRLAQGQLVGWLQGRAEFGPRALGNRSILADPRFAETQDHINAKIKFRESFRPFAPSVLDEYADDYFEHCQPSPYMDKTLRIREPLRDKVQAVCHVDGTGRLQTVSSDANPRFYELIEQFRRLTGVPMLLNTSFNVMGKPLVHSLDDALVVFMSSGLDVLVVNDYLISKARDE